MGEMHAVLCPEPACVGRGDEAARYVDTVFCGEAESAWEGHLLLADMQSDYALLDLNRATFIARAVSPGQAEAGLASARQNIARWPIALRRARRTWRDTDGTAPPSIGSAVKCVA